MQSQGFRILAIEPDSTCGENLKRLIRDRVAADIVVASSSGAAVGALCSRLPDLLLTSAILTPQGEAEVMAQLKRLDVEGKVQVLTIPPLVDLEEPQITRGGPFGFLRHRPAPQVPTYDRNALAARIVEALEHSRVEGTARRLRLVKSSATSRVASGDSTFRSDVNLSLAPAAPSPSESIQIIRPRHAPRHRRAHRMTPAELPWPCIVKMPNLDVRLLNLSRSGMLVESTVRFTLDSPIHFQLYRAETSLTIPGRFVRSEVSAVDVHGVRYQAAAVFDRKVELFPRADAPAQTSAGAARALADLLVQVTSELDQGGTPAGLRTTFEKGLQQLVPGCAISLRETPLDPTDGSDSIFFTVPMAKRSGAILQATFDPDYELALEEFRLLKAAAAVAAVIVQYEGAWPTAAR